MFCPLCEHDFHSCYLESLASLSCNFEITRWFNGLDHSPFPTADSLIAQTDESDSGNVRTRDVNISYEIKMHAIWLRLWERPFLFVCFSMFQIITILMWWSVFRLSPYVLAEKWGGGQEDKLLQSQHSSTHDFSISWDLKANVLCYMRFSVETWNQSSQLHPVLHHPLRITTNDNTVDFTNQTEIREIIWLVTGARPAQNLLEVNICLHCWKSLVNDTTSSFQLLLTRGVSLKAMSSMNSFLTVHSTR